MIELFNSSFSSHMFYTYWRWHNRLSFNVTGRLRWACMQAWESTCSGLCLRYLGYAWSLAKKHGGRIKTFSMDDCPPPQKKKLQRDIEGSQICWCSFKDPENYTSWWHLKQGMFFFQDKWSSLKYQRIPMRIDSFNPILSRGQFWIPSWMMYWGWQRAITI